MALGHLDELQKAEKYPIRWSLYTGFTGTSNVSCFHCHISWHNKLRRIYASVNSVIIQVLVFHMFQAEPLSESLLACRDLDV